MRKQITAGVLVLLLAAPAGALSLIPIPFVDMVDESDSIVLGTVVEHRVEKNPLDKMTYTYCTVRVESDDKLPESATRPAEVVVRVMGGTIGDTTVLVPGVKPPAVGKDVYLFLAKDKTYKNQHVIMGMVQGHFRLVKNPATGKVMAKGMMHGVDELDPTSRAKARAGSSLDPASPIPSSVDFEELRAAVRQQVIRALDPAYKAKKKAEKRQQQR